MKRAALYARVSTDLQEKEETIESQVEELRHRARDSGYELVVEYLDDGYSGATLKRPGLDRLRDALGRGEFDLVLFHSPDRLARKVVYQFLVLEEMEKAGVRPEFLNFSIDDSPESRMLLGMQGIFAEYERAKIMERTRRGKLLRAREGALVGGHAPYGYRWIKRDENGRARLEVVEYPAVVVQRMYRLLLEERISTWAIARKLTLEGVPTARGAAQWQPMAVHRILINSVYKGSYQFRPSNHEVISIPVPQIVDEATWQAAQAQLEQNGLYSRRNNKRHQYLLRKLIRCPRCGGPYSGYMQHGSRGYRCNHAHWTISSTGERCSPGAIPAAPVEEAVWEAVKEAFQKRGLLEAEYTRRLAESGSSSSLELQRKQVALALKRVKAQEDRVTDAYINEAMDLDRYKPEMERLKVRRQELEQMVQELKRGARQEQADQNALEALKAFCDRVGEGLEGMNFEEKQHLLQLVVEGITVEDNRVRVKTVIPVEEGDKLRNVRGELVEP
jgi:site-specific DNA recombinase